MNLKVSPEVSLGMSELNETTRCLNINENNLNDVVVARRGIIWCEWIVCFPEVADVCAFLASDDSQYITGASIEVTGAFT